MKRVGVCVISHFFAWAIVFSIKTIPDTNTACDRYFPEHSITESTQTSYTLLKQLFPEPFVVLYWVDGTPARRIGGYICPKSAVIMARDYHNLGGRFASSAVRRSPTRDKETDAIPGRLR
jgi:hypothetical protein